jgi:hypothetical protein
VDEEDLIKTGMEVALRPVTEIAEDALGILGGDWLSEIRARNRAKLKSRTEEILRDRDAEPTANPSPSVVTPLLSVAQDESRDELIEIWASLLASAIDPKTQSRYRREFLNIARQLEPLDAAVLRAIANFAEPPPQRSGLSRIAILAENLGKPAGEIELAVMALNRLGLTNTANGHDPADPRLVQTGIQFMRAISPAGEA